MGVIEIEDKSILQPLFSGWEETLIWSCLQNVMGRAFADREKDPCSAQLVIGDFCFLSGKPDAELIANKPSGRQSDFIIMVPNDEAWSEAIEKVWKSSASRRSRYAIKKEPDVFDRELLNRAVESLSPSFSLRMIDEGLYRRVMEQDWSRDLCSQFSDYEDYRKRGIGVVALSGEEVVSGASSYTVYHGGIEIEIDTKKEYRRQGLAFSCGAKLILECLKRGLYPSWDAHNPGSVALAEKLGYHFDREYPVYEITGY
ncbi:acetyltransferase [Lacrimispora amygdalina]|uniref:Acetyltransferase n=1 Tax=Lacrimispora amygdalina TaxID=253257 RepID=A0A3E2NHW4_9FIRM|nr:GNAT family N-acetyltransferase [Clostridium indicum]RFZ80594.1 GNAT family N-acetyltransferase [Clostridium indicum]